MKRDLKQSAIAIVIAIVLLLSQSIAGCHAAETRPDIPEQLTGTVVDQDTREVLKGVNVIVYLTDRHFVAVLGPEGMTRPRDRNITGAYSDDNGQFTVDLRKAKAELGAAYPGKEFAVGQILAYKDGYVVSSGNYSKPGPQLLNLKRK